MTRPIRNRGFSLVEIAVALLILGLLLGGGLGALAASMEQARHSQQARQMERIREALYGFAMSTGRLPCADAEQPPDGYESRNADDSGCVADDGVLPWATLGIGRRDAWGHPLYYRVTSAFTGEVPTGGAAFGLETDGNLTVRDDEGVSIATSVPAVVVAWGETGGRVQTAAGLQCPANGLSVDERRNCDGTTGFIDAGHRTAAAPAGPFRHHLAWPSRLVLKSRMVDAGRLP